MRPPAAIAWSPPATQVGETANPPGMAVGLLSTIVPVKRGGGSFPPPPPHERGLAVSPTSLPSSERSRGWHAWSRAAISSARSLASIACPATVDRAHQIIFTPPRNAEQSSSLPCIATPSSRANLVAQVGATLQWASIAVGDEPQIERAVEIVRGLLATGRATPA
jgi:hypothetical protein